MRYWTRGRKRDVGVLRRFCGEALPRRAGNIFGSSFLGSFRSAVNAREQ